MQVFSEKAKVYNYSCQLRDRLRTGSQELNDLLKSIDKQKQELISLNVAIRETGDRVTQIIKNCIAETLPT
jgi:septal ring factor EnvC (AmiA/AmiB activator)